MHSVDHAQTNALDAAFRTNRRSGEQVVSWKFFFLRQIELPNEVGCMLWRGTINKTTGYGSFKIRQQVWRTHRLSYEMFVGGLADDMTLDHLCRNRACVTPDHLEQVSLRENILRGTGFSARNARKTHCKNGHEFTPENTRWYGPTKTWRNCKTCAVAWERNRKPVSRSRKAA